jgi:hypothetical protein
VKKLITRAVKALKPPPPSDSLQYRLGLENGLDAALNVAIKTLEDQGESSLIPDIVEYGVRTPGGTVYHSFSPDVKEEAEERLVRMRDMHPDAVLVSRPVFYGEWEETS